MTWCWGIWLPPIRKIFQLDKKGADWHWRNLLLDEEQQFRYGDADSLPYEPLDWAGRQVQEDLVLVSPE